MIINGKHYERLDFDCDCGPTTRECGADDEWEEWEHPPKVSPLGYKGPGRPRGSGYIFDPEKLEFLYHKLGMTLKKIADKSYQYFGHDVTETTILRMMRKYGIETRKTNGKYA